MVEPVGKVAELPVVKKCVKRHDKKVSARVAKKDLPPIVLDQKELNSQTQSQLDEHFAIISTIVSQDSYSRTLEHAKDLIKSVYLYHGGGRVLGSDMIVNIGEYLKNKNYHYYTHKDFDLKPEVYRYIKSAVENGFKFSANYSMRLMRIYGDLIDPIMKTYNNVLDYDFLCGVEDEEMEDESLKQLIETKKIKFNFTQEQRDQYMNNKISNSVIVSALLDDPSIVITPEFTMGVAKNHKIDLLKQVIMSGGVLDNDVLESACISSIDRFEKVKFILDNKIEPTQKAFLAVLGVDDGQDYYRRRRHTWHQHYRNDESKGMAAVVNLFPEYGYVVTYDDLKAALKQSVVIKNVERFNIKFDETYLHICSEIGMYPYKTKDISPDMTCLTNECKKPGNLALIKKIVNNNKLTPDETCMREACKHTGNLQTLKFLNSKGGRIDFECLKNVIDVQQIKTLTYVLEEFEKHNSTVLKDLKDVKKMKPCIKDKTKRAKKDFSDSDDDVPKKVKKYDSADDSDDVSSKKSTKKVMPDSESDNDSESPKKPTKKVKKIKKSTKNNSSDSEEPVKAIVKVEPIQTSASSKTSKTKKANKDDDLTSEGPGNMTVEVTEEPQVVVSPMKSEIKRSVSLIPKELTSRDLVYNKIPATIKKLLNVTIKNKSMNYLDFRTMLLEYVNRNEMIIDKLITVKAPLLYNGSSSVSFKDINEWTYSLLSGGAEKKGSKSDTKDTDAKKSKVTKKKAKKDATEDDEETEALETVSQGSVVATIMDIDDDDADVDKRRVRRATASKSAKKTVNPSTLSKTTKIKVSAGKDTGEEDGLKRVAKKSVVKKSMSDDSEKETAKDKNVKKAPVKGAAKSVTKKTISKKSTKSSTTDSDEEESIQVKKTVAKDVGKTMTNSKANSKAKAKSMSDASDESEESEKSDNSDAPKTSAKTATKVANTVKVASKISNKATSVNAKAKRGAGSKKKSDDDLVTF